MQFRSIKEAYHIIYKHYIYTGKTFHPVSEKNQNYKFQYSVLKILNTQAGGMGKYYFKNMQQRLEMVKVSSQENVNICLKKQKRQH